MKTKTIGNILSFKTYSWLGVNDTSIPFPAFEKKPFPLESDTDRLDDFDQDKYGISEDVNEINKEYNNLYRSYKTGGEIKEALDISLDGENNQLFDSHDIVAEEGGRVNLIISYTGEGDEEKIRSSQYRIKAGKDSDVKLFIILNDDKKTKVFHSLYAKADEGANVEVYEYVLGSNELYFNDRVDLIGDESQLNIDSIYFAQGKDKMDIQYDIIQHGKNTYSDLKVDGALKGESVKKFKSTLDFPRGSSQSKGSEEEYVVLLDDDVHSFSVPVLLAGEDDIEGNHAASEGKIDKDMLFYIMSRGLSQADAEGLVINSRFSRAIDALEDEARRDMIQEEINRLMR